MTKEQLLTTILKTSFSRTDLHRRVRLWRAFLEKQYFGKGKRDALLKFLTSEKVSVADTEAIVSWGDAFYETFTKDNAYELTDILIESLKGLQLVNLYVPFEPTEQDLQRYGEWFRANVDKYILIDVHVDSATFGGCAFAIEGVMRDYSLRSRLEGYTPQIHEILGKYVSE